MRVQVFKMDHQSDVQRQSLQEQHQSIQEQQNIVYIQQNSQNYRNQNFSYLNHGQTNITGNQSLQSHNASFGQFENHYPFVTNGHFSSSNSSATIISDSINGNKIKNVQIPVENPQYVLENESESGSQHQGDVPVQFTSGNFQSVDLQGLNYQQTSPYFVQNIGNNYQLNDNLIAMYQSSGSSESSDESSASNVSQLQYSSDSSGISNNHFEFPVPVPANNQIGQNLQQFQQKDILDNYMALLHQDTQVPRCDSSKSEAAESTCSSLSSGSVESQSENENVLRLPLIVNPLLNNNSNILHSYQTNLPNNISSYSNSVEHNDCSEYQQTNYLNQTDQNLLKYSNFHGGVNPQNVSSENISNINNIVPSNNQNNNLVLMVPNRINGKTSQNYLQANGNPPILPNPSSQDVLHPSKFIFQNARVNQQKIYGLINLTNPVLQDKMMGPVSMNSTMKMNQIGNDSQKDSSIKRNNTSDCSTCHSEDNGTNSSNSKQNCGRSPNSHPFNHHTTSEVTDNCTSHVQNTSDSSVINSNFVLCNVSTNGMESENPSAMLLKETSDKSIRQSVSDVNSSVVDLNNVYLVKNDDEDNNIIKSSGYENVPSKSELNRSSGMTSVPVPAGWRRLLVDGSVIYLSPTNVALSSIEQVKMYLQTTGTCKCGLECPVNCDSVFNFSPKVISRPWDSFYSEQTRLCNHKRKASFTGPDILDPNKNINTSRKDIIPTKRKKKKNGSGSGVSVSQLLAQRDQALAAAARWPISATRTGPITVGYPNVMTTASGLSHQYQNIEVLRPQAPGGDNNAQPAESFKRETPPARAPDDKVTQFPSVNVINREGPVLSLNGMSQLLPEAHSAGNELIRSSELNSHSLTSSGQEVGQGVINHPVEYTQCGEEFVQNASLKPEGVVLGQAQNMLFPPNMIMQRPRSIPPWHQTRLGLNKRPPGPDTQVIYEKVPYIQQQQSAAPPTVVYEDVITRKKPKSTPKAKKVSQGPPAPPPTNHQPSFMENPSAYLAQQTALLHDTISRPNLSILSDTPSGTELPQNLHNSLSASAGATQGAIESNTNMTSSTVALSSSQNVAFSVRPVTSQKIDQSNYVQPQVCHKNVVRADTNETSPERRLITYKKPESSMTVNSHVTNGTDRNKPCLFAKSAASKETSEDVSGNEKTVYKQEGLRKSDSDGFNKKTYSRSNWRDVAKCGKMSLSEVKQEETSSVEENPVTSSTEKVPMVYSQRVVSDTRPIQGGTVSTSNGSPQPQSSPNSSNIFRQEVSSPKQSEFLPQSSALQITSSDSYSVASNLLAVQVEQENEAGSRRFDSNSNLKRKGIDVLQSYANTVKSIPAEGEQKQKFINGTLVNLTTSSSDQIVEPDASKDHGKTQFVTSSIDVKECQQKSSEAKCNRFIKTMASSHTASSNTITSVQAGKAQTATVTVSNSTTMPPSSTSLFNMSNQNLLNIQIAQKGNPKSPLEMVQSIVSSLQSPAEVKSDQPAIDNVSSNKSVLSPPNALSTILTSTSNVATSILSSTNSNATPMLKTSPGTLQAGHILVSSNGQYLVAANGNIIPQTNLSGLKLNQTAPMPPMSASSVVTNVTGAVTQVLPAVGVTQQVLGQPTVLVNTVPTPFVIQPGVMAVDTGLGRLAVATGNVLQGSVIESTALRNSVRGVVSAEKVKYKKGTKKRKNQVASLVQMAPSNNVILNQTFGQQNFAVSPGGSVQPLQALTLVQGKQGQIVMNSQNNFSQFSGQPQQINLLQPVNLTSVPNFPAFQQFIVPGLGNMVMSTDGTAAILPDTTNIGVQLQLQNVNGQNVLTPVQNTSFLNGHGILTTPTGMFIRAPNNQQKIIQNNASPQFLSPNSSQFLVNQFQGQLSPLIAANLSPNQQLFATSPQRQSPQEFIQIIPTSSSQNTTVVQQNTTIVQQQTTMVSNNQNLINNSGKSNFILSNSNADKPIEVQIVGTAQPRQAHPVPSVPNPQAQATQQLSRKQPHQEKIDFGTQHSVSTQTNVNQESTNIGVTTNNTFCQTLNSTWSGSPPDTTTHSPVESDSTYDRIQSPTDEGPDGLRQAMVQYVSSSINEGEGDGEGYLIPGVPKVMTSCESSSKSKSKGKNVVESSTVLQETGVQIQIGRHYMSADNLKPIVDECIVSSHSDVNVQEKHLDSQSNICSYQKDKLCLVDALLAETKSDDEGVTDSKEKLKEGDLIWGPVRGCPSWPGKLVSPIGPGGKALVRWFGGHSSPTKVNVSQLQSLSQGLEAHHRASNKGRKNRRLNAELEAAIQEAMLELDRMTAQGKKISTGRGRPRRLNR